MRIGILTSFPDERGTGKSGVASYSKTILDPLRSNGDEFIILADAPRDGHLGETERYAPNMTIRRCWKFGHLSPFQIALEVLRHRIDVLHVEWEPYLYGGAVAAVLLPFVLGLIRALRRMQIVTTVHSVVSLRVITREMLRENGFVLPYSAIGRFGFLTIYKLFDWISDRIIVLEEELASTLESEYAVRRSKLFVCPHPLMHEAPRRSIAEARERCGIGDGKIALFFGYASYYKGLDVLLDAFELARRRVPDLALIIVAARHPRLKGEERYEAFYERLRERARSVGAQLYDYYVPEPQLADLLGAADVVVLPYTAAYGASGPLNAVFAARKPVLVSNYLRFEGALRCQTFAPEPQACAGAIVDYFETNEHRLTERVEGIARMHDPAVIARMIQDVRCGRPRADVSFVSEMPAAVADAEIRKMEPR
jgi:glycosyltransferase involved in cell wall biosynthesis